MTHYFLQGLGAGLGGHMGPGLRARNHAGIGASSWRRGTPGRNELPPADVVAHVREPPVSGPPVPGHLAPDLRGTVHAFADEPQSSTPLRFVTIDSNEEADGGRVRPGGRSCGDGRGDQHRWRAQLAGRSWWPPSAPAVIGQGGLGTGAATGRGGHTGGRGRRLLG